MNKTSALKLFEYGSNFKDIFQLKAKTKVRIQEGKDSADKKQSEKENDDAPTISHTTSPRYVH